MMGKKIDFSKQLVIKGISIPKICYFFCKCELIYESVLLSAFLPFESGCFNFFVIKNALLIIPCQTYEKIGHITSKGRHKNEGNIVDENTKLGLSMHYTITVAHRQKAMHSSNAPTMPKIFQNSSLRLNKRRRAIIISIQ